MELVRKNINIKNYQCLNTNPNFMVFSGFDASGNLTWKFNIPEYDKDGNITFNPYGRVMADFYLPHIELNQYNPYYLFSTISYNQIRLMYDNIVRYQDFVKTLCKECNLNVTSVVNEYIDLLDEYYYSDGDFLFKYLTNLLFIKLPKYRPLKTGQLSFLNYVLSQCSTNTTYPFNFTTDYSLLTILGTIDNVNSFMTDYVLSVGKIDTIIDLISTYILDNNTTLVYDLRDINSEVRNSVIDFIYQCVIDYYDLYNNCIPLTVPVYNNYNYVINQSPVISLPILITSDFEDLGISFNPVEEWVSGRKYYVGEVVLYNGSTYILQDTGSTPLPTDDSGFSYFTGVKNVVENIVYFDEFNVDSDGFTISFKMNGNDFTHWKRNVKNAYKSNDKQFVQARIDTQIETLKSYRDSSVYTNFWDVNGNFKPNIYFNQEFLMGDDGVERIYRSYIKNIYLKESDANGNQKFYLNTVDITSSTSALQTLQEIINQFSFSIDAVGHDFILYEYIIDECVINNVAVNSGITFSEIYNRYKINPTDYVYDFQEQPFVSYEISNSNTIDNFTQDNIDNDNIYIKGEDIINYAPQSKKEYENGIVFPATVQSDVFIDRGINYVLDKHFKLSECKSLTHLVRHGNSNTFVLKND
jgi:hypothetical protein